MPELNIPRPTGNVPNRVGTIPMPTQNTNTNPLSSFFRKPKFHLSLPSKGQWYPPRAIKYDEKGDGTISVYAMTAEDDVKFKTGDITLTGSNIFDIIRSCVPSLVSPENIPHIDVDTIMLAIRGASYGSRFEFLIPIPNTNNLTRKVMIDTIELLNENNHRVETWDENLEIEDENGQKMKIVVHPIPIKSVFETSKTIFDNRNALSRSVDMENESVKNTEAFQETLGKLTHASLGLLCSAIQKIVLEDVSGQILISLDKHSPQDAVKIMNLMQSIDVSYFNAIRTHIDLQRQKYTYKYPMKATIEEINAGAPESWVADLSFIGSSFMPSGL